VKRQRVHGKRISEQVEPLTVGADGVGSAEPERVIERPVDGLGIVASGIERPECRIGGRDGSDVLGSVELPHAVFVVAMEADDDDAAAEVVGQAVVVVPAVGAGLVCLAAGADPVEFGEELVAVSVRVRMPMAPARANRSTVRWAPSGRVRSATRRRWASRAVPIGGAPGDEHGLGTRVLGKVQSLRNTMSAVLTDRLLVVVRGWWPLRRAASGVEPEPSSCHSTALRSDGWERRRRSW
jgi:hypothetical protein